MKTGKTDNPGKNDEGSFPILAIIMITMLIFAGLSFIKWGADEHWETRHKIARLQAYYGAHAGLNFEGFNELRKIQPSTMPQYGYYFTPASIKTKAGEDVAKFYPNSGYIKPNLNQGGTGLADFNFVDVTTKSYVTFPGIGSEDIVVEDSCQITIRLLNISNFLYLTEKETTVFGERIKFWSQDTLDGWVHSNDTIAIMQSPVFYDHVTTTAPVFWQGPSFNPIFVNYPPIFEYREISLPDSAVQVRMAAASGGTYFDDAGGTLAHRLVFRDFQGWILYYWTLGTPFSDSIRASGPPPAYESIFIDGYLELEGIVRGQVTVGAHGNPTFLGYNCIRLMDDIRYWFADPVTGQFNDSTGGFTDILGIISEGNIVIGNTWANGREGSSQGNSIIVTAALVALGESFSFEDQNDDYLWEFSTGYVIPNTFPNDERGIIYVKGAVTQYRRGYVHRSNHGGTGYGKQYKYDKRLNSMPPPFFLDATDEEGYALFEIVAWDQFAN